MKIKGLKKLSARTKEIKKNGGYIKVGYNAQTNTVKGYWCYFKDTVVKDVNVVLIVDCPMSKKELKKVINRKLSQNR